MIVVMYCYEIYALILIVPTQWRSKGAQGVLDPGWHHVGGGTLLIKIKY